jgi:2'-5' RNA ligase
MRLFLAIELPDVLRSSLSSLQGVLRSAWPGWRWVRPEGIHLTVRFLGEVETGLDAASREAWRAAAGGVQPFDIRLGRLGRFPKGGAPRVLWVGIEEVGGGGQLPALAESVEQAARDAGFDAEKRPFRPHLTLARASRRERPRWAEGIEIEQGEAVRVGQLILFSSQLHPAGARYTAIDRFMLEGCNE